MSVELRIQSKAAQRIRVFICLLENVIAKCLVSLVAMFSPKSQKVSSGGESGDGDDQRQEEEVVSEGNMMGTSVSVWGETNGRTEWIQNGAKREELKMQEGLLCSLSVSLSLFLWRLAGPPPRRCGFPLP